MDGENICLLKQFLLRNQSRTGCRSLFWRKILAPRHDFHSECARYTGNFPPDIAEAKHPEHLPSKAVTNCSLPATGPNRSGFDDQISCARENESPRQLYGRTGVVVGVPDFDTAF